MFTRDRHSIGGKRGPHPTGDGSDSLQERDSTRRHRQDSDRDHDPHKSTRGRPGYARIERSQDLTSTRDDYKRSESLRSDHRGSTCHDRPSRRGSHHQRHETSGPDIATANLTSGGDRETSAGHRRSHQRYTRAQLEGGTDRKGSRGDLDCGVENDLDLTNSHLSLRGITFEFSDKLVEWGKRKLRLGSFRSRSTPSGAGEGLGRSRTGLTTRMGITRTGPGPRPRSRRGTRKTRGPRGDGSPGEGITGRTSVDEHRMRRRHTVHDDTSGKGRGPTQLAEDTEGEPGLSRKPSRHSKHGQGHGGRRDKRGGEGHGRYGNSDSDTEGVHQDKQTRSRRGSRVSRSDDEIQRRRQSTGRWDDSRTPSVRTTSRRNSHVKDERDHSPLRFSKDDTYRKRTSFYGLSRRESSATGQTEGGRVRSLQQNIADFKQERPKRCKRRSHQRNDAPGSSGEKLDSSGSPHYSPGVTSSSGGDNLSSPTSQSRRGHAFDGDLSHDENSSPSSSSGQKLRRVQPSRRTTGGGGERYAPRRFTAAGTSARPRTPPQSSFGANTGTVGGGQSIAARGSKGGADDDGNSTDSWDKSDEDDK